MGKPEKPAVGDDGANRALFESLAGHLEPDDDPQFWSALLRAVLREIDARWTADEPDGPSVRRVHVALSKIQNCARPHQSRWLADGSFAAPIPSSSPPAQGALWTVWLSRSRGESEWRWTGESEPGSRRKGDFTVRLSAPGRTVHHSQAAVTGEWRPTLPWLERAGTEAGWAWYGFRRTREAGWKLTAHHESKPQR